ncbi:MAG: ribonuclease HIII [Puniceicoccaceae bacterium]
MPKKTPPPAPKEPGKRTSYTVALDSEGIEKLESCFDTGDWKWAEVPHALFSYKGDKVNITAYKSGKCLIQGAETETFITNILEPMVTGVAALGYDEIHHPEWFETHAGVDESGKGDLFGPLVSATVIADGKAVSHWLTNGVRDSKTVGSDQQILKLEQQIRETEGVEIHLSWARMEKYNQLYGKFGNNLNRLLAWFHARSIRAALAAKPAQWGLLDQFTKQPLVQRQLKDLSFELRMRTRAESDPVVAAASIVARAEYVRQMDLLSKKAGFPLMKGASSKVREQAVRLIQTFGPERLGEFAKLHFKTAQEALASVDPTR